ncbi:hypothetical protein [uncultured Granulicatella sp.]|uniref:hypothetical protein n=1 Tax=uncultured Granulicatella sp. TaxID=316089 RepID=UPI0028D5EDD2|nr:hypothetical protein [uncultured Granulicatella sp.]
MDDLIKDDTLIVKNKLDGTNDPLDIKTDLIDTETTIINKEKKYLKVSGLQKDINFTGLVDKVAQYVNIADIVSNIEKSAEYVVQIPAKYKDAFDAGEVFINKNKKTGIEWPTLMRKTDNGQYRFVGDLPIKQQEFYRGNPFQEICINYHNIVTQQQLAEISQSIVETYQTVKMIERGQQDDRIALIDAGREQVLLAMTMTDENEKKEMLRVAARDLLVGKEQIGKALMCRVEAFESIPDSGLKIFLNTLKDGNYLNKKDDEIEDIQECYSLYVEATKMLAVIFAYSGETVAVEQTFSRSIDFLQQINFEDLKSIEHSHKGVDFNDWFFNHPVEYIEIEKTSFIESSKDYDFLQIEITGEKLLEGVISNEKISEE